MENSDEEDDYLQLSGLQHFALCKRRWALIFLENKWQDNWRTIDGTNVHKRAHDNSLVEKRGNCIIMRALKVVSHTLKLSGECDVVEFHKHEDGITLTGYEDKYLPFPIEYKRGEPKSIEMDKIQLCAQAMCLEEMLLCEIPEGALFYGEPHRRFGINFSKDLKEKVTLNSKEMNKMINLAITPEAHLTEYCNQCSLVNECLPKIKKKWDVEKYILTHMENN